MSDGQSPADGTGNQFYDEAADWFTKMRGPNADTHQAEFDAWLKRGALHRAAYNRIAEIFLDSDGDAPPIPETLRRRRLQPVPAIFAAILVALGALSLSLWLAFSQGHDERTTNDIGKNLSAAPRLVTYATAVGEVRRFRLGDGSLITLDTDSLLATDFSQSERRLRLLRGRARFDVAHEARPFRVAAGTGMITAHGTIFDVMLQDGKMVSVQLLRGAIDVAMAGRAEQKSQSSAIQHLKPGQATSFKDRFTLAEPTDQEPDTQWPQGRAEFQDVAMEEVVETANRYFIVPIELEGDGIGKLRVTGIFSMKDGRALAQKLAHLLDLDVRVEPQRIVVRMPARASRK
ncbi:FecR family protein [Sphingobium sp. RAC03]|uniref:FecR family protein n=1 Tax=Sphingobium sp. RAC03 TaxID=1843368 RepID=UPI00083E5613|nr:FecR domain-containing protein [Sphingobium sp. RAC03]AOF97743.1 fecR family protein [Sphingobium sp. RAC03]